MNSQTDTECIAAPIAPPEAGTPIIVGIGASAGGLDALEAFLRQVPADSGMAFVVIQHQDPNFRGILPELLQHAARMPVMEAGNQMPVRANTVYVIPPNKDLSLLHGVLHLFDPVLPRGMRLPIDGFLRALAEDRQEKAIGVILSGMGSDGTLGLRAIKEKGGLTLVQTPAQARFDGMPSSAINAGLADIVGTAGELPDKILAWPRYTTPPGDMQPPPEADLQDSLEKIAILLRERSNNDFSLYKQTTVWRRIERRMGLHQLGTVQNYVRYLQENPQEVDLLFKELLIGVTRFFRDPDVWAYLGNDALPALLARYPDGRAMRAWVAGCSTGEEAYTLAMVFREVQEKLDPQGRFSLQIFATDLDGDAIDKARQGLYLPNIAADVTPQRLQRFFFKVEENYRITKSIREMVVFASQNLIADPPFTKLDILSCRNLLIYLNGELQSRLIPLFHYALYPDGLLLLGSAETIGNANTLFAPMAGKFRLYRRLFGTLQTQRMIFPTKHFSAVPTEMDEQHIVKPAINLQAIADKVLLQDYAPAAAVVTAEGDIVHISGRTGKYLEPAAGKANWNIFAMAREGLRREIMNALKEVLQQGGPVRLDGLHVMGNSGTVQDVDVIVQTLDRPPGHPPMIMIVFMDMAIVQIPAGEPDTLAVQLQNAREEIRIIREEMQSSQEELTSINEQLQSTNEELQSTNEEVTTTKEEMQSLNNELQTVNMELQSKVNELSVINKDMKHLLNSIDTAIVFLDSELKVRRYTTQATDIFKLTPRDVGRPLSDIAHNLQFPDPGLREASVKVLHDQQVAEYQIANDEGHWFKVRIQPYRTADNLDDGVVLTFADISQSKGTEAGLRKELEEERDK